jgi:endoglucanase
MNALDILKELCSIPTAPFAEHRVLAWVDSFARQRRFRLSNDRFGNRLIEMGPKSNRPRLVFVAHTDHPGMVADKMIGPRKLLARFHGGVYSQYVAGAKAHFFDDSREVAGRIARITRSSDRADVPAEVEVDVKQSVAAGAVGMFDLGVGRIKGRKFYSRVCDDLAGVAAVLAAMDNLRGKKLKAPVAALLTRAEEDGFIGAIAAVTDGSLLRKSDRVISVECSAIQPYAQQGNGVILRVGDRISIFNSAFTYWMNQQCEALAKDDKSFKYQRCLMPGGACEGTVFDAYGYVAAAACVPLGNYHNMDRQHEKLAPEFIDLSDWQNEVKLFTRLGEQAGAIDLKFGALKNRLQTRFNAMKKYL